METRKLKCKIRSVVEPEPEINQSKILMQEMTKYGAVTNRLPPYSALERKAGRAERAT